MLTDYMIETTSQTAMLRSRVSARVAICEFEGSTPIPLGSYAVFHQPTGPVVIYTPLHDLVMSGLAFTSQMAFLPINPLDEAIVEEAVNETLANSSQRPLVRKR
jgi:hypothetical protein